MKSITQRLGRYVLYTAIGLFAVPVTVNAQEGEHGGGGGGGGGCGDVFGDLIHILRDDLTGQPILAQRWVEMPAGLEGFGWGYCPIAVETVCDPATGVCEQHELGFEPFSCDVASEDLEKVEAVDYFGRLNGGRTKERNNRMHFDEVISNIKASGFVGIEATGRLEFGFDCSTIGERSSCGYFEAVDSPMESMALYVRVMKYGHIATDPYELDTWAHGDPKAGPQFHPALSESDWPKFHKSIEHLLPGEGDFDTEDCWDDSEEAAESYTDANDNGKWDPAEPFIDIDGDGEYDPDSPRPEPFTDLDGDGQWNDAEWFDDENENGVADEFTFTCADPEHLSDKDFVSGATYLAAAASKHGFATRDLLQYMNRILKIAKKTGATESTLDTVPALYRDCWADDDLDPTAVPDDPLETDLVWVDPTYLDADECPILLADSNPTNADLYPDMQERFVDYMRFEAYERDDFDKVDIVLKEPYVNSWHLSTDEPLLEWVELVNGVFDEDPSSIEGVVDAINDVIRSIEYVHNYDPPEDLYCFYDLEGCYAD